jgi:hypothetical protein
MRACRWVGSATQDKEKMLRTEQRPGSSSSATGAGKSRSFERRGILAKARHFINSEIAIARERNR